MTDYNTSYDAWFKSELDKFGQWEWNDTGVDAVLLEQDERVEIERITAFFTAIDAPYLKKGNIQKLHDLGYDSIVSIILMSRRQIVDALGENGGKIYDGLALKLTNIPLYAILGAHATARGIGQRKIKKLQKALGGQNLLICTNAGLIAHQDGFDDTSALKVVRCLEEFRTFLKEVANSDLTIDYNLATGGSMTGQNIVFTGFRDKTLSQQVEAEGGNIQSAVSGKTNILVAANPTSNSGKMKKARDKGVLVIGIDEFKDML